MKLGYLVPGKPHLHSLTSLRFFAAALVVFFHCGQSAFTPAPDWLRRLIMNGYQAVSFFFVLSGFVLTYTYFNGNNPSRLICTRSKFWIARIARIYPIYIVGLAIALFPFIYKSFVNPKVPVWNFICGAISVPLLAQSWIPPVALTWNAPAWSLSVEALFYLTFPIWVRHIDRLPARQMLMLSTISLVVFHLGRHYCQPLPESGAAAITSNFKHYFFAYFPLFHLPSFIFGMTLGRIYLEKLYTLGQTLSSALFVTAIALLGNLFSMFGRIDPVFLSDAVLVPIYGIIILSATNLMMPIKFITEQRVLVVMGEASYGLYILHAPLWFLVSVGMSAFGFAKARSGPFFFWCFLLLVIGISLVGFYQIEKPWRIRMKSWLTRRLQTSQATVLSL